MKKICKYLIIGNSAGGIGAAEAIRQKDRNGSLVILSDEAYHAYSRPLISKYLAGRCSLEDMLYRPADFYSKNNIEVVLGATVTRLDAANRTAATSNGDTFVFEKLLLALGGKPIVPPIKDMDKDSVITFTKLDDAKRLREAAASGARRAVVVGGGLIGMSVSEALVGLGMEVTVVELKDRVLSLALDKTCSQVVEKTLRENGINVLTGQSVTGVIPGDAGRVKAAVLSSGQQVACDLVVLAIGVIPRSDLAAGTGIATNRGIVVDRHMKTSLDNVYACGDVAEASDILLGANRVLPIWPSAYIGGRVAGFNMFGATTEYPGWVSHNAFNYFGLSIVSAGTVEPEDPKGYDVMTWSDKDSYRKVVLKDKRIVGMALSGDIQRAGVLFNLMREKIDVERFKGSLLAPGFGLISLPADIKEQMLSKPGITDVCLTLIKQPELALSR